MTNSRETAPGAIKPEQSQQVMELIEKCEKDLTLHDLKNLLLLHDNIHWRVFRDAVTMLVADALASDNVLVVQDLGMDVAPGTKKIWELQTALDVSGLLQENER
jgi:hypothetical protein